MMIQRLAIVAVLGASISCGSNDDMNMSDYAVDLDAHVEAMRTDLATHSAEIAVAQDVDGMMRSETAHRQRYEDHMDRMNMVMGDMMSCTDGKGTRIDHGPLSEMMHGVESECDKHRDAMRDLNDLETRRGEEARHQGATKDLLDQMKGQMGTMMSMGGAYSCGHCTHCGM